MRQILRRSLVSGSFLLITACSGNSAAPGGGKGGPDATAGPGALPCDVDAVLAAHCRSCHQNPPINSAPMPLVTWEDLQAPSHSNPSVPVYKMVQTRIHDDHAPMPQPPNPRLSPADTATLDAWVNAGGPASTSACTVDPSVPDAAPPTVTCSTNNVQLAPSAPWTMPTTDDDDYVCYGVDLPVEAGTNHVMAITPNVDNKKIVHHILLFQADSAMPSTPAKCSAGGSLQWRIVYGWAPGGGPMQTPPNVGFPYTSTTHWVVQVHYNNINHLPGEQDTSGFSFCSTDQPVQYDADVVAFGTQNISIQPQQQLDETCSLTVPKLFAGIHLFASFPHMHQLGTAIETVQTTTGGGIVDLGRNEPWNFNNQIWFPIDSTLAQGDTVSTRCVWMNNTANVVNFGQNTENEMCYSFTAYYPRVNSAFWSWALPAIQASCQPSAGPLPTPDAGWSEPGAPTQPISDAGAD